MGVLRHLRRFERYSTWPGAKNLCCNRVPTIDQADGLTPNNRPIIAGARLLPIFMSAARFVFAKAGSRLLDTFGASVTHGWSLTTFWH